MWVERWFSSLGFADKPVCSFILDGRQTNTSLLYWVFSRLVDWQNGLFNKRNLQRWFWLQVMQIKASIGGISFTQGANKPVQEDEKDTTSEMKARQVDLLNKLNYGCNLCPKCINVWLRVWSGAYAIWGSGPLDRFICTKNVFWWNINSTRLLDSSHIITTNIYHPQRGRRSGWSFWVV